MLVLLLIVIAVSGLFATSLLYLQHRKDEKTISASSKNGQSEAQELVRKVSRLMMLPTNEKPTIATVSDLRKLQGQEFFKNAHNGDKVLIYTKAKMAILYDPKQNLILAVSPLNIQSDTVPKS
jgi:hypothetical protein